MMLAQVAHLSKRSVLRTIRQPAAIIPALLFPVLLITLTSAGLNAAEKVPGFPAPSYLSFVLAGIFVQGAMVNGLNSGSDLALDIQNGFLNRLSLTPISGSALILGHMSGAMVVGFLQTIVFLAYGRIVGVDIAGGWQGMLVILGLALLVSIVYSGIGGLLAARLGSAEAVQGMFPLVFILMTFSSFFLPRNLITADWFRHIATYNPITYFIEAIRSLIIDGFQARELALGIGLGVAVGFISIAAAGAALRTRLARG